MACLFNTRRGHKRVWDKYREVELSQAKAAPLQAMGALLRCRNFYSCLFACIRGLFVICVNLRLFFSLVVTTAPETRVPLLSG
jgi:hypothetical protein